MNHLDEVISKIRKGEVVLWAGSGLSLYAGYPTSQKLVGVIKNRLHKEEKQYFEDKYELSRVAEEFVRIRDNDRSEIIKILKEDMTQKCTIQPGV